MYRDLDPRNWPADTPLTHHPLIRQLAGVDSLTPDSPQSIPDPNTLDDTVPPNECFQVVDADSSQQAAILAAKQGLNLVIDGPPGTGKSQTITNIIAECLAEGKSVLFVSEKSAALDVVRRRLQAINLGDFVLELHSRKSSKRTVLQELQRVLSQQDPPPKVHDVEAQELQSVRNRLNAFHRQLHTPINPLGLSPFQAISRAIHLSHYPEASCPIPDLLSFSAQDLLDAEEKLSTLDRRLRHIGPLSLHPWRGSGVVPPTLESRQRISTCCANLQQSLTNLLSTATTLSHLLTPDSHTTDVAPSVAAPSPNTLAVSRTQPRPPLALRPSDFVIDSDFGLRNSDFPSPLLNCNTIRSIETLLSTAHLLLSAPALPPAALADPTWDSLSPQLQKFLTLGQDRTRRKLIWSQYLNPAAEQIDWCDTLRRRDSQKASWLRFLQPSWYADNKRLRSHLLDPTLPPIEEQLRILQALISSADLRKSIEVDAPAFAPLFGPLWQGPDSDWSLLRKYAESLVAIRQLIRNQTISLPTAQRLLSTDHRPELSAAIRQLEHHLTSATTAFHDWLSSLHTTEPQWLSAQFPINHPPTTPTTDPTSSKPRDLSLGPPNEPPSLAASLSSTLAVSRTHPAATPLSQPHDTSQQRKDFTTIHLPTLLARLSPLPQQLDQLQDWSDLQSLLHTCASTPLKPFIDWALSLPEHPSHAEAERSPAPAPPSSPASPALDPPSPPPSLRASVPSCLRASDPPHDPSPLAPTFLRHFHRLWLDHTLPTLPALKSFRGDDHQALINRFIQLDLHWLESSRHRLSALISSRRPDINHNAHRQSKLGILLAEIRKKARHMPLRKLLASVGDVVQSIKPCFMMSPLSVAQYLAPGGLTFDVVIFDEASQVEPADAYGAIARGRQLLLVGDENQLPPTNFFAKIDTDPFATDEQEVDFRATDLESILSLGIVRLPHRCRLRWHYRSRHASLIEFSNRSFYESSLRVFPSPHTDCSELGLSFRYIENAIYKRGTGRYNPVEAQTVAQAVLDHALHTPHLSLGVGTLNLPQQQAIEDEIERLRRQSTDPRVEEFFASHEDEPFFVKNLESIQGDERDVIFLSVGYGKDAAGNFSANFGPLNADGGWRRLNVLVTRARQRCLVFSSIHADDIPLSPTAPRGVAALKTYLHTAEQSPVASTPLPAPGAARSTAPDRSPNANPAPTLPPTPGAERSEAPDLSVVSDLSTTLQQLGWTVHTHVGPPGFAVDLAIVNPHHPARYLLGIECDGRTYHQSPTARDRDRLRPSVLQNLGWSLHRLWSLDWLHRRPQTLNTLLHHLDQQSAQSRVCFSTPTQNPPSPTTPPPPDTPPTPPTPSLPANIHKEKIENPDAPLPDGVVEYTRPPTVVLGGQSVLLEMAPGGLAEVLSRLVEVEFPLHIDEAMRLIADIFSTRVSPRLRQAVNRAVHTGLASQKFSQRGDFLWPTATPVAPIRYRGHDCPVTKPELIAPEEYQAAIKLALTKELGLKPDALLASTIKLMGFARSTANLRAAVEFALQQLIDNKEVTTDNAGFLILNEKH